MNIELLQNKKEKLEREIDELIADLEGDKNPKVLEKVKRLWSQEASFQNKLSKLTTEKNSVQVEINNLQTKILKLSSSKKTLLLEQIRNQRWWFIENKSEIFFDSHTGMLWTHSSNTDLLQNASDWKNDEFGSDYMFMLEHHPFEETAFDEVFYNAKFASREFEPQNETNNEEYKREQKILTLFLQEGWTPKFEEIEEEKTEEKKQLDEIYNKLAVVLPQRLQSLAELSEITEQVDEALESTSKQPLSSSFDLEKDLKDYDLICIDQSAMQYALNLNLWIDNLFSRIDEFSLKNSELLKLTESVCSRMSHPLEIDKNLHAESGELLEFRHNQLRQYLDFGLDSVRSKLLLIQKQGRELGKTLEKASNSDNILEALANIQNQQRPTFKFIAEYTSEIVVSQLSKLEWFQERQDFIDLVVSAHFDWAENFDIFVNKEMLDFVKTCEKEQIETELVELWEKEWLRDRTLIESKLMPLFLLGIDGIIPTEIIISILENFGKLRDNFNVFYEKERIGIHQKYAFQAGGDLQEKFEAEVELFKINSNFQSNLEDIIFDLQESAQQIALLRWSEDWFKQQISQTLTVVKQSKILEDGEISKEILDGFRTLQQSNLEAFLQDAKRFSEARKEREDEYNSLVFRMRKELMQQENKKGA